MAITWVKIKTINIGVRESTDSLTPLKFNKIRKHTPIRAKESLYGCHVTGKKLNSASAPLETEIVIVST